MNIKAKVKEFIDVGWREDLSDERIESLRRTIEGLTGYDQSTFEARDNLYDQIAEIRNKQYQREEIRETLKCVAGCSLLLGGYAGLLAWGCKEGKKWVGDGDGIGEKVWFKCNRRLTERDRVRLSMEAAKTDKPLYDICKEWGFINNK